MTWNQEKKKQQKDSFWYGFIPGIILPTAFLITLFKLKYTTNQPIFEAMYKFSKTGMMGKDMITSTLPCFVLFMVFYKLKMERATQGVFVGLAPFLILSFWLF